MMDEFCFGADLSNPCYVEPEEPKRERAVEAVKSFYAQNMPLEDIHQRVARHFIPGISMSETRKMLGLPNETREEAFARLRPEVIRLMDAAMSIEEIAAQFDLPEETIEAILSSQQDDQG
jgi:DNA-binding NarL/FixJ family response regulator